MLAPEAIRRVKAAQDHYAVLGVTRNATPEEIKKAYRKISLILHPDKCTDPSKQDAYSEAFKKVGAAHSVLSKPESRRVYDNHGDVGVQAHESGNNPAQAARAERHRQQYGGGGGGYQRQQFTEADLFEELFGSLFGATPRQRAQQQQQQRQRAQQQQQQQQQYYQQGRRPGQQAPRQQGEGEVNLGFFMIIPLLLFIAMNFVLTMGGENSTSTGGWGGSRGAKGVDGLFSLTRDPRNGFTFARHVEQVPEVDDVRVNYFVRGDFNERLRRSRMSTRSVELHVARQTRDSLGRRCRAELQSMQQNAMRSGGRPQSCNDYDKLRHVPAV